MRAERVAVARAITPPTEAERGRSFLILPFRNVARAADYEWLVEGSPILLADALSRWEEIHVVRSERLLPALARHGLSVGDVIDLDRSRQLAAETGGWTVVTGEFLATGSRTRVSMRAYDAVTQREILSTNAEIVAGSDEREVYERLAGELLTAAGLEGSALDLSSATTQSLDAYRAYLRGIAHDNRSEYRQAREAFLEAARLDSNFAQAYARVAEVMVASMDFMANPETPGRRFAARAAALASRLPTRERELVRAMDAFYGGRFGESRTTLERLVAADSSDLDVLQWLALVEAWDPILDPTTGLRRGSLNAAVRLAKTGLGLDPTRHRFYMVLVFSYARAGGLWAGITPLWRREASSLQETVRRFPDAAFGSLMTDSIEELPIEVLNEMGESDVQAGRDRALATARAWVDRWLAAGPAEAEAHLWASRIHELEGDFTSALEAIQRADTLGIQSAWDDLATRRMILLGKLGQYTEAVRLADSLVQSDYWSRIVAVTLPTAYEGAGWALMLFLREGRMERAEAAIEPVLAALRGAVGPAGDGLANQLLCGSGMGFIDLPGQLRRDVASQATTHLPRLPVTGFLPSCLITLIGSTDFMEDEAARASLLAAAKASGRELADSGRGALAVQVAVTLINADTTVAGRMEMLEMLRDIVALDPNNFGAVYQIGKIGALTGMELDLAQESLERYLTRPVEPGGPSHAGAHWRLGMIHEHRGDIDRARAAYEESLRLEPGYEPAQAALEALNARIP